MHIVSGCLRLAAYLAVITSISYQASEAAQLTHPTKHYSFHYPESWKVSQPHLATDGPAVLLYSPRGEWFRRGGLLPPGGIKIIVQVFDSAAVDENAVLVATGATGVARSVHAINNRGVLRADYDRHFGEQLTYRETSVCVHVGEKLFLIKIIYEHVPPEPQELAKGEAALSQIVSSLSLGSRK